MKANTFVMVLTGLCYVLIGGLSNLGASLAQWANSGEWPQKINWVVIIGACIVGAATQLLAFLSQAYGNWKQEQNGGAPAKKGTNEVS